MLYIRKSKQREEWILYNPDSFETCHTHCRHKRVAVKIKYLVEHHIVPYSRDIRFVESCIRVTKNKIYLKKLQDYLLELTSQKCMSNSNYNSCISKVDDTGNRICNGDGIERMKSA